MDIPAPIARRLNSVASGTSCCAATSEQASTSPEASLRPTNMALTIIRVEEVQNDSNKTDQEQNTPKNRKGTRKDDRIKEKRGMAVTPRQ